MATNKPENQKKGPYGVFDELTEAELESAIQKALDDNTEICDIGNEPIFRLCQYFKGLRSPKDTSADLLRPFVEQFFNKHPELQEIYDFTEVMLMFEDIWEKDKVEHPKMAYFKIAVRRADHQTTIRPEIAWCKDPLIRRLDDVCFELQKLRKELPFWMSQYQAATVIDKAPRMGRYALDKLERKRNLKRHETGSVEGRLANSYFYIGRAEIPADIQKPGDFEQRKRKMIQDVRQS